MIFWSKSGEFFKQDNDALFEFLGIKKDTAGVHKVKSNIELIAPVPLCKVETSGGILWTLSTFDLDRMGERIDPAGWDFSRFMENPVVEWAHRWDIPAIGKIEALYIDQTGLNGVLHFNDKAFDPFGWAIGERVKAGVLRSGSVGFRPIEIEIPGKADSADGTTLIFRKQELLEFSVCNVPANPYALAKLKSEKAGQTTAPFWGGLITSIEGAI